MMHGGVDPIHIHIPVPPNEEEKEYQLTGASLPSNTQLFAPVILGNSYYDHIESNEFIHKIHKEYLDKMRDGRPPDNYINYCLDRIREFEKEDVAMCEIKMAASGAMLHQNEEKARKERLKMSETVVHKSCVEWRKHEHFIEQKTYSIHRVDKPPNSIMFFCQEDGRPNAMDLAFKQRFDSITGICEFDRKMPGRPGGTKDTINFECACDLQSQICSIRFTDTRDVHLIPFHTIQEMLLELVSAVYNIDDDRKIHISLSFFDFTCDDLRFPGVYHEVHGSFRPVFISSNEREQTLVYGTIGKEIAERIEHEHTGVFKWAQYGSPSPQPPDARLRVRPYETGSIRPGGAAAIVPSVSPGVPPTSTLTVHLSSDVMSFADFVSKFKDRPRSVSPGIKMYSGSHRTHTRRCRSRHHPRVGKKVSLRHGRRRRRGTMANSTRSNRKRKTTK
jgi:hypothetical protein